MTAPLADGYHLVPAGKLAAVVTSLEMRERPTMSPGVAPDGLSLRRVERPAPDWYRALFRAVGAPWLWVSRLRLDDAALVAILHHPDVEVHALSGRDGDCGLLELDFREPQSCELAFFGVVPALLGRGAGRFLAGAAIERAWRRPIRRFWVHTCTLDHPAALAFYERAGFKPFRREVEILDDPRVLGLLPLDAAPDVPVL